MKAVKRIRVGLNGWALLKVRIEIIRHPNAGCHQLCGAFFSVSDDDRTGRYFNAENELEGRTPVTVGCWNKIDKHPPGFSYGKHTAVSQSVIVRTPATTVNLLLP